MAACHKLIRKTAMDMAQSVYEDLAKDNKWLAWSHQQGISEKHFVNNLWPRLVADARTTLAQMLASNIPESLKEEISNALIADAELPKGRVQQLHRG